MNGARLSIPVIAKNEARNLPVLFKSLQSLKESLALQVVVADTGSTDDTVQVAESAGAEVFHFTWVNDFSQARNYAVERCTGDWIFWLDADDILPLKTADWLIKHLLKLSDDKIYFFNIVSPLQDGSESHFSQSRLFPNGKGIRFSNPIHESISQSARQLGLGGGDTGLEVIHTGYALESVLAEKKKRNLQFLEKEACKADVPIAVLFSLARSYQVDSRYSEALALFRRILDRPNAADMQKDVYLASCIYLGQTLGFMGRISEAADFFKQHGEIGANHPQYLFEWGKILLVSGDKELAERHFKKVLWLGPWKWTIPTDWQSIMNAANDFLAQIREDKINNSNNPDSRIQSLKFAQQSLTLRHISICTIVKNEEKEIAVLGSHLPLDQVEWIVVDTGSSDGTLDVISKFGVIPYHFQWSDNFSTARNYSLENATRPWILWLDADDRLPDGFWKDLEKATAGILSEDGPFACRLIINSPRDDGTREMFRQVRLIPNQCGIWFEGRIHEQLGTSLQKRGIPVRDLDVTILHRGYFTAKSREEKLQRNYQLLKEEIKAFPSDSAVIMAFGNCLFQQGRYLDSARTYEKFLENQGYLKKPDIVPENDVVKAFPSLIATAFDMVGEKSAADKWYNICLRWDAENPQPLYWMGKQALERKDLSAALGFFEKVIALPARITRIAFDNETLRRNALGFLILGKLQKASVPHAEVQRHLTELIEGGLERFPIDYKIPAEYYASTDATGNLIEYYSKYLEVFPDDTEMYENFIEAIIINKDFNRARHVFDKNPELKLKSGVLAAFHGKCLESLVRDGAEFEAEGVYQAYLTGLKLFPTEPTLLVYMAEWINLRRNFAQAYKDLLSLNSPSAELKKFIRQLRDLTSSEKRLDLGPG